MLDVRQSADAIHTGKDALLNKFVLNVKNRKSWSIYVIRYTVCWLNQFFFNEDKQKKTCVHACAFLETRELQK